MGTSSTSGRRRSEPAATRSAVPAGEESTGEAVGCCPVAGLVHPAVLARSADPTGADPLGGRQVSAGVADSLGRSRGSGDRLPQPLAQDLGGQLGHDLGGVRVHTDRAADTLARSLQAVAFTHGSDVYFSAGSYDPGSDRGRHLLAHELTHVVQNSRASGSASVPTVGRADDPAEAEADRSAARVVSALRRRAAGTAADRTAAGHAFDDHAPADHAPADHVAADHVAEDRVRRRAAVATLRRARAKGDASPVTNDDLGMEIFGVDKKSPEFNPSERGGHLYVGSPGEGFWGTVTLDENAPGPVTVEAGFLQKLVVNNVKADYGAEDEEDICFAEDGAAPHKDPPSEDGAWTYESDKPLEQLVEPGGEGTWQDLDRPMAGFAPVEEGKPLNFWEAELGFETVFVARVKGTDQPWAQVEGGWEWNAHGGRHGTERNEVESIAVSTEKVAEAWDPEQVRTLPHANSLPKTWRRR